MATFRFLHCADVHLDSPLRGLEANPDAPADRIRRATRRALENLVDFVLREKLDFVVAAGDLYDGDWQDWRTGQFLIAQIGRLTAAGIPFVAIRGNHDAESVITRRLRMPHLLDTKRPETIRLPNLPVSVHGQSFATRAVTANLARDYPAADANRFNIGLLHTSVDGREGHDSYAPCSVEQLSGHGYQYWALGHVHQREVLSETPWIVFPGNLQGRHINEAGPKGATLVTVIDDRVAKAEPIVLDDVRWARIEVAVPADADEDAALALTRTRLLAAYEQAGGRLLATRIVLSGACAAHAAFSASLHGAKEKLRAEAMTIDGPDAIWTEKITLATRPVIDTASLRNREDAIGRLACALETIDPEQLGGALKSYAEKLLGHASWPRLEQADHALIKAAEGEISPELIERARDLLLARIAEG
nr:DNA repair exonuclease [uncultured Rhodopila sp.]